MGIKFQCPNGHRLHVKSELAGKRGICPECSTKVLIPSPNPGEPATALPAEQSSASPAVDQAPSQTSTSEQEVPATPAPLETPTVVPAAEPTAAASVEPTEPTVAESESPAAPKPAESIEWYVRPVGGGQFGPCPTETFAEWINEGRVAPESYVWRSGWGDWQRALEASDTLPAPLPRPTAVDVPQVGPAAAAVAPAVEATPALEEGAPAAIRLERARKRRQRGKLIAGILLLVLTIGLGVALVIVLN